MQLTQEQIRRIVGNAVSRATTSVSNVINGSTIVGEARHAASADEATHALDSDHATSSATLDDDSDVWAKLKELYLSKTHADTAQGLITFLKGLSLGDGSHGLTESGVATLLSLVLGEGGKYGVTKDGLGTLSGLVAGAMQTTGYTTPDMHGQGAAVYQQGGLGYTVTDYLTVRVKAIFQELEIRELNYVAGNYIFSHAGGTIISGEELQGTGLSPVTMVDDDFNTVTDEDKKTGWKVYFKADDGETRVRNMWRAGDQALCQTFNIDSPSTYRNASNRYYWRLVTEAGTEDVAITRQDGTTETRQLAYIVLSDKDEFTGAIGKDKDVYAEGYDGSDAATSIWIGRDPLTRGGSSDKSSASYEQYRTAADTMLKLKGVSSGFANDTPAAGDRLGQAGCQAQGLVRERGGMVEIVTEGIGSEPVPAINVYASMNSYRWSRYKVIQISPDGIIGVAKNFSLTTDSTAGDPVRNFNYRGEWAAGLSYDYYDAVTHDGLLWLCAAQDGCTGSEPSLHNADWSLVSGGGDLRIEFYGTKSVVPMRGCSLEVEARLVMAGRDITESELLSDPSATMAWTRDSGVESEDKAWTPTTGSAANVLLVDHHDPPGEGQRLDLGSRWAQTGSCSFTFTATLGGAEPRTLSATLPVGA